MPYRNDKLIYAICIFLFSTWCIFQIVNFLSGVFVPDEEWFMQDGYHFSAMKPDAGFLFGTNNHLGYGALYWILLAGFAKFSLLLGTKYHTYQLMVAATTLVLMLLPLFLLFKYIKLISVNNLLACLCIFISMPMMWWTGKIVGPETISQSLGLLGIIVVCLAPQRKYSSIVGGILLGIGIGIKLTTVPMLVFALTIYAFDKRFSETAKLLAASALGYLVANPFLLIHPNFFVSAAQLDFNSMFSLPKFERIFSSGSWAWDAVYIGGISQWGLNTIALLIVIPIFAFFIPLKYAVAFAISFVSGLLMILSASNFSPWYFTATLLLVPVTFGFLKLNQSSAIAYVLTSMLVVLNLFTSIPMIYYQTKIKLDLYSYSREKTKNRGEVETILMDKNVNKNYALIDYSDAQPLGLATEFSEKKVAMEAYSFLLDNNKVIDRPTVILLGERISRHLGSQNEVFFSKLKRAAHFTTRDKRIAVYIIE